MQIFTKQTGRMRFPHHPLQTPLDPIFEIVVYDTPSVCFPQNSFKHLLLNGITKILSLQTERFVPFIKHSRLYSWFRLTGRWWRKAVSPGTFRTGIPGVAGERDLWDRSDYNEFEKMVERPLFPRHLPDDVGKEGKKDGTFRKISIFIVFR